MEKISAYCTLGESKCPDANEIKKLSRLPLEISPEDPSIIIFPKNKISIVEKHLKPFGINLVTN